jgi:hypothetical protein
LREGKPGIEWELGQVIAEFDERSNLWFETKVQN